MLQRFNIIALFAMILLAVVVYGAPVQDNRGIQKFNHLRKRAAPVTVPDGDENEAEEEEADEDESPASAARGAVGKGNPTGEKDENEAEADEDDRGD
ncbi:hypothetical protein BJV82DRAFT_588255 [Fennellomyces sp. T-0311]|nr:hypothetical protein BJV82DRAFT_588255 [Fennellomyces sp. T-0311]